MQHINDNYFYNFFSGDVSNAVHKIPSTNCLLFSTDFVACVPALKYILKCDRDYTYWPFFYDHQMCRIY